MMRSARALLRALTVVMAATVVALAQAPPQSTSRAPSPRPTSNANEPGKTPETKAVSREAAKLSSLTVVNPEALAKDVRPETKSTKGAVKATVPSSGSTVTEFQAAPEGAGLADGLLVESSKSPKRSALKNVHGDVMGALGQGNASGQAVGAAAGATTKSGKTYIYVQTDKSKSSSSR
ncbi:MAG: hypothetical protein ACRD2P_02035 [Terriglobia bacterium]